MRDELTLFPDKPNPFRPLADRMRPRTLDEFVGQEQILGPGRLLRRIIETDRIYSSLIFWGPPGTGKTSLAMIIANHTRSRFESISAVLSGIADLRKIIDDATTVRERRSQRTILLVDEIHRWNKAQQDALLPKVEDGTIILIGATTENPFFEVIRPLLSRSRVFQFVPLRNADLVKLIRAALADPERGYGNRQIILDEGVPELWADLSDGDARTALNALELAVESTEPDSDGVIRIGIETAQESIQRRIARYDKSADEHYDTISAFIKSVRGSDVDAALYWLAKMINAGEDPRFIMRRLLILASEDIGMADPNAIVVVAACARALEWVGMPEAQYHLSHATIYLATAPKSNSAGAYFSALREIEEHGAGDVPLHLRDTSRDGKALGHGKGYKYPHDYPGHWVQQQYLPDGIEGGWYQPSDQGFEKQIQKRFEQNRSTAKRKGGDQ